jgi:hypothetical protein
MTFHLEQATKKELVLALNQLIDHYVNQGADLKSLKKFFKHQSNFKQLLKDIRYAGMQMISNEQAYEETARKILDEVMEDRLAEVKDQLMNFEQYLTENQQENLQCPHCGLFFEKRMVADRGHYLECPHCQTPVIKKITEAKNFSEWLINEINLPLLKINDITTDIDPVNNVYKSVLVTKFKSQPEYIDVMDKQTHHFKVNDLSGDIMGTNRVVFDVLIYNNNDLNQIKNNIVKRCLEDFELQLPDQLNIFGINIKPIMFMDKNMLQETFESMITLEEVNNIITSITGFKPEPKFNDFFIWSNLKSSKTG